jgi:hypothetical protein
MNDDEPDPGENLPTGEEPEHDPGENLPDADE